MARPTTATRAGILQAAMTRFSRYGFRRTSMEDIAGEAGISRAALYLQFRNKEEIFRSLAEGLHEESLARARTALAGDRPLPDRLRGAIEGKSLRLVELMHDSPHGGELLDESSRLCGDIARASERRFTALLTGALRQAARSGEIDPAALGLTPAGAAELLLHAAGGLKGPTVDPATYRRRVAGLVRLVHAALAAGEKRRATAPRPRSARGRPSLPGRAR